ncbi:MAG TPA: transposase [Polyangiaceae bacterium]|nr:transposase [Polyangiaceae bacterium]
MHKLAGWSAACSVSYRLTPSTSPLPCRPSLPSQLRPLALANRTLLFDLLFACAGETLLELGRDPRWLGAELGITSVLHTWTRELLFHPHVHCIVTGGGVFRCIRSAVPGASDQDSGYPIRNRSEATRTGVGQTVG